MKASELPEPARTSAASGVHMAHVEALDPCPLCGADLDGGPVPDDLIAKGFYKPGTRWGRAIGIYSRELDRTTAYQCPDCGGTWPRERGRANA